MTRDTRRAGALVVALGGVVAVLALMAGPAAANEHTSGHTSGGAVATGGSVASGDAHAANGSTASGDSTAVNGSTASGDATAVNGSTASGCSEAFNYSTASGDDHCEAHKKRHDHDKDKDGHKRVGGVGGGAATPARASLALTGTWSVQLTALAALAVVLGALLMVPGSRRRATSRA